MILGKKRRLGRKIEDIKVGEKLMLTEKIEDKDLLLYLGLTNDANPLYIQHDFASQTVYEKPIVPSIMLTGIVTSATSKYLPGPGSHVVGQNLQFPKVVYHYSTIEFSFEVALVNTEKNLIEVNIEAIDEQKDTVISGVITVVPPKVVDRLTSQAMDNF
ncbi:MaoC/PaaZ C-terminal domain-containing protein [Sporosarcina sp. CAU 1771]